MAFLVVRVVRIGPRYDRGHGGKRGRAGEASS